MVQIINRVVPGRIYARCMDDLYIVEFDGCAYNVAEGELNPCVEEYLQEKGITRLDTFETIISAYETTIFGIHGLREPITASALTSYSLFSRSPKRIKSMPLVCQFLDNFYQCQTKWYKIGTGALQVRLKSMQQHNQDTSPDVALDFAFRQYGNIVDHVHVFPVVRLKIVQSRHDSDSSNEFSAMVCDVLNDFGFFILRKPITPPGLVIVDVIGAECALAIAHEIEELFRNTGEQPLIIPARLIHPALVSHPLTIKEVRHWLHQFPIKSLRCVNNRWLGPAQEINALSEQLRSYTTEVQLSHVAVPLTWPITLGIRSQLRSIFPARGWSLDEQHQVIIAPREELGEVQSFLKEVAPAGHSHILGCVMLCENPRLTTHQLTLYTKGGAHQTSSLCADCLKYSLEKFTQGFFIDEVMDFEKLSTITQAMPSIPVIDSVIDGNAYWPQIPLGQLLLTLLSEPELAQLVKAWVSGILSSALRNTPQYFTYCPDHPHVILLAPQREQGTQYMNCGIPWCTNVYCVNCEKWHDQNDLEICRNNQYKGPRCPNCKVATIKSGGCNHIHCQHCFKHWCYYCGYLADTGLEVYAHFDNTGHIMTERPATP
jgi:hypothetical protein